MLIISTVQMESTKDKLFQYIESLGRSSPLIHHFAQCERNGLPYTTLDRTQELFKVRTVTKKGVNTRSFGMPKTMADKDPKSQQAFNKMYYMPGGASVYAKICEEDNLFWYNIIQVCKDKSNDIYISRVDICEDLSYDLMSLIAQHLISGEYLSSQYQPYIIGYRNGIPFSGVFGKNSAARAEVIANNETLELETVYFGHVRRDQTSIVFYDKRAHLRKQGVIHSGEPITRIEARYWMSNLDYGSPVVERVWNVLESKLQESYSHASALFLNCVSSIVFTKQKRLSYKELQSCYLDKLSPWWISCLETFILLHCICCKITVLNEADKRLVISTLLPTNRRSLWVKDPVNNAPLIGAEAIFKTIGLKKNNQKLLSTKKIDIPVKESQTMGKTESVIDIQTVVLKSSRGRKIGSKDSKPRVRRTNQEITLQAKLEPLKVASKRGRKPGSKDSKPRIKRVENTDE